MVLSAWVKVHGFFLAYKDTVLEGAESITIVLVDGRGVKSFIVFLFNLFCSYAHFVVGFHFWSEKLLFAAGDYLCRQT